MFVQQTSISTSLDYSVKIVLEPFHLIINLAHNVMILRTSISRQVFFQNTAQSVTETKPATQPAIHALIQVSTLMLRTTGRVKIAIIRSQTVLNATSKMATA